MTLNATDPNNGCCVPAPPAAQPTTKERFATLGSAPGPIPTFPTKGAREAFVRARIAASAAWAYRALTVIFHYQTADVQELDVTTNANRVGFTGHDAELLSSFAKQYLAAHGRVGLKARLSPRQQEIVMRRMPKYTKQLIAHMERDGNAAMLVVRGTKAAS